MDLSFFDMEDGSAVNLRPQGWIQMGIEIMLQIESKE